VDTAPSVENSTSTKNPGTYSIEERENQIALLRQLRRKRHQAPLLIPESLVKSAEAGTAIDLREELKSVSKTEYETPVVSLYLRLTPDKVAPEPRALVRFFRSMKSAELERRKDFVEALPKIKQESLTYDLREIEAFLEQYFVPAAVHSLIIFKSGEMLNRVITFPIHMMDSLTIDPDPYVLPLEIVFEEHQRVLFLEITKPESRFLVYHLGYCFEADRLQSFVPSDRVDKSNPGHVQRHRLTHLEWHLKSTAERASQLYRLHSCQAVIVMAEERISHMFEKYLPDAVRGRIITRIFGSPVADPRERRDLIENAIQGHKAISETAAITEVKEHKPHEDVISSLADVIDALNLFLVRKLVISGSLRQSGFVCRDHHFVSLHEGTCPFCGKQLLAVENVIDEIVEIARAHGMSVTIVEYNESLLAAYGGIVAILYPHTAQLAEAA
jgi:hypothetical protein